MIAQEELTSERLVRELLTLYEEREKYKAAMRGSNQSDAVAYLCDQIEEVAGKAEGGLA